MYAVGRRERGERIVEVLLEAYTIHDDSKAAERHGITDRTLRNSRNRLSRNEELSGIFQEKKRKAFEEWADPVRAALRFAVVTMLAERG